MNSERLQSGCWRGYLPLVVLTGLLAGCSMPGKGSSEGPFSKLMPAKAVSYQPAVVIETPKKIADPIALKLRYAEWMEEIENFNEAHANYNFVLQERPENVDAILGLARIDQAAGRLSAAEVGYKKALSLRPDSAVAKNALGQYYASHQRWTEALPLLNEAMLGDPANKAYRYHLAVALATSGDMAAALPHFRHSVGDAVAHYNMGMILKSQGLYLQAEQQFRQALTSDPNLKQARQAIAEVRQQAQAAETYAAGQRAVNPSIRAVGHSRPNNYTQVQQQQLQNQRSRSR